MKKLVCSAMALSLTSAVGAANGDDWSVLDREIEALPTSNLAIENNIAFNGFLRTRYDQGDPEGGVGDMGGFHVNDARLSATASLGDYVVFMEYDFADEFIRDSMGGNAEIDTPFKDAFIQFPVCSNTRGQVGRFQSPILGTALVPRENLVFTHRTWSGENFRRRDEGAMAYGEYDQLAWYVAIQNGFEGDPNAPGGSVGDDKDDRYLISGRVVAGLTGTRQEFINEGSIGASDELYAEIGVSYFENEARPAAAETGNGFAVDFRARTSVYSFGFDAVAYGDGGFTTDRNNVVGENSVANQMALGGTTPLSFTGTYMFQPNAWEAAFRYQDGDDFLDSTQIDVGINHYLDGHALKWQAQYTQFEADDGAGNDFDRDLFSIGVVASF